MGGGESGKPGVFRIDGEDRLMPGVTYGLYLLGPLTGFATTITCSSR